MRAVSGLIGEQLIAGQSAFRKGDAEPGVLTLGHSQSCSSICVSEGRNGPACAIIESML